MALSFNLEKAGHPAKRVSTTATVKLEPADSGFKITSIDLRTEAEVPGMDESKFREQAELTKKTCPRSEEHTSSSHSQISYAVFCLKKKTRWGIKVTAIEITPLYLREPMVRAIAQPAEAERLRRATVISRLR